MSTYPKKCTCSTKNNTGTCSKCSRIKMVCNLKNGWEQFKVSYGGKDVNPVFYNYVKENHLSSQQIIQKMLNRLNGNVLITQATNVIQFYENGQLIADLKP